MITLVSFVQVMQRTVVVQMYIDSYFCYPSKIQLCAIALVGFEKLVSVDDAASAPL